MRPATVRRFSAWLFAGLILAAVGFDRASRWNAVPPPAAPPANAADIAFAQYCGSCHTVEELRPRLAALDERQRAAMEVFLQTHTEAPAEANRVVLGYLSRNES